MIVLGCDPGTTQSALVAYEPVAKIVLWAAIEPNQTIVNRLTHRDWVKQTVADTLVIEQIESFGMAVGKEVFETVWWSGRFGQAWVHGAEVERLARMPRRTVKLHLCGSMRAKDPNIRQALLDRFGTVGTKKHPGPLYGVSSHCWAALACAVTWADQQAGLLRPGVRGEF